MTATIEWSQDVLPLFEAQPLVLPDYAPSAGIQARFEAFHEANPWVMEALVTLTADYAARGRTRIGIKMLFEVLRWHYGRQTTGDEFRLNNNYPSRYVRLLIAENPAYAGMFFTRELRAT